ncbi:MAG: glycine oxidase ThiO [Bacteroidota bacterium]
MLIVGGGVIGLSIAWKALDAGQQVLVFDRGEPGRGTSWDAAGMLAPAAEIGFEELDVYALGRESLSRWRSFAADLEAASGRPVDYRDDGTLLVADDRDAAEALRRHYEFQRSHGVPVEWLRAGEAQDIEPFLAPRLAGAVYSPEDHQVDNRKLVEALRAAVIKLGGQIHSNEAVQAVHTHPSRPAVVLASGETVETDQVVLSAGVWSTGVDGLEPAPLPIRPVKGQMMQLQMERPFGLKHVVRGPGAYLAPKSDGRLVVGATTEEMGFDQRVTAGGLYGLLEHAWEIVPGILELEVESTWAGLRPASQDHAPLIGPIAPGVYTATGHYRHGILLAPVTAEEAVTELVRGEPSGHLEAFRPGRFVR